MTTLRHKAIKLAFNNPGVLRDALIPVLSERGASSRLARGAWTGEQKQPTMYSWNSRDADFTLTYRDNNRQGGWYLVVGSQEYPVPNHTSIYEGQQAVKAAEDMLFKLGVHPDQQ